MACQWYMDQGGWLSTALKTPCPNVFISLGGVDVGNGARMTETMFYVAEIACLFREQDREIYLVQYDADPRTDLTFWLGAKKLNAELRTAVPYAHVCRFDMVLKWWAGDLSGFHPSSQGHKKIESYMERTYPL